MAYGDVYSFSANIPSSMGVGDGKGVAKAYVNDVVS
jgi:hypothetical protein